MDKEWGLKKRIPEPEVQADVCVDLGCTNFGTEYSENTTLHGLRYVGDSKLHLIERFYWVVAFIFGVLGAAYFISSLYARWRDSPMIVSLSPTPISLSDIPFPAVTICNMNRAMKSMAAPIKSSLNTETNDTAQYEKDVLHDFCGGDPFFTEDNNTIIRAPANWTMVKNVLIKVSHTCEDMLIGCNWQNAYFPCMYEFNAQLSGEGMCCSFNKVDQSFIYRNPYQELGMVNNTPTEPELIGVDWTPEKGFPKGTPLDFKPWRARGPGASMGLYVYLDAKVDEYFCSDTDSAGFKVMLHNPLDSAHRMSDVAHLIPVGFETRVEIKPDITTAAQNLGNVPQAKRQCYFSSERALQFFRTYTQKNCETECYSNITKLVCECVPFYLPRDEESRICGMTDEECVIIIKSHMEALNLAAVENDTQTLIFVGAAVDCSCLPACVNIDYAKEMSISKLHFNRDAIDPEHSPLYYKENVAVVHFYFGEKSFIGVEQGEIFGFTEFISNTGGLLGLFMGFSIMSIIEMVYFLSLRFLFSWLRSKNDIIQPVFMKTDTRIRLWNP